MFARFFPAQKEVTDKTQAAAVAIDSKKLAELAAMAEFIYDPKRVPQNLPNGWYLNNLFMPEYWPTDTHGFMGAMFMRFAADGNRTAEIAIIYRGSVISEVENLLGDLEIAMNKAPLQTEVAAQWVDEKLKLWRDMDPYHGSDVDNVPVWHVGHSLGAIIANCMFVRDYPNHLTQPGRLQCVTFEKPGADKIALAYSMANLKIPEDYARDRMDKLEPFASSYQTDVNIINSCNKQWGNVQHVKIPYRYSFPQKPNLPAPSDRIASNYVEPPFYYIRTYSFVDQHNMLNLLNYINKGVDIVDAKDRNPGFAIGYSQYLDGEKRKDYWLGYFKIVWDEHEEIRNSFHNRYDSFLKFRFEELRSLQVQSLIASPIIVNDDDYVLVEKEVEMKRLAI